MSVRERINRAKAARFLAREIVKKLGKDILDKYWPQIQLEHAGVIAEHNITKKDVGRQMARVLRT